uniref:Wall-associated receptor kinase-like 16 n=1 Tax=Nelumbo nucifera TaxID=4432 RepID=A0A822Z4M3_NELNU|nr:TPA_asm: hypothetical protein HUJ06_014100 [Nelumbo nucifera]
MSSSLSSGYSFTSGCISFCTSHETLINGSCSGIGCCQTSIPNGLHTFNVSLSSFYNHTYSSEFNPCSYAFLADQDWFNNFNFSSPDLMDLPKKRLPIRYDGAPVTPVVLDWVIPDDNCTYAIKNRTSYACGNNTYCSDSSNPTGGYNCHCKQGYRGNPYLPLGCQDIDECKEDNNCTHVCTNTVGSYKCSCPKGTHGDGFKEGSGTGCIKNQSRVIEIALAGGSCVLLFLVIGVGWSCWVFQKRKLKQKFFQENGGVFLKQLLALHGDDSERKLKIFTSEELRKATKNYNESRIVGKGAYGTVYKGTLPDERDIAIKMSKETNKIQIKEFINEIVILARLNHENVVKLLGCCLETPVPILVYEFITRGTLFHRIHGDGRQKFVFSSWEHRLRIAAETAGALAYLHSVGDPPIIHGDVKSTNILLDDKFTAKVSDFGASRFVPLNQMQLSTLVQGTFGYIDPEYMQTKQLTDKSDVYSFGAVLVELLTGKKIYSDGRLEERKNMAKYFVSSMKQNRLFDILDDEVMHGGNRTQLQGVAEIAEQCLRLSGEERPTMREVAVELDYLRGRGVGKHSWVKENYDEESVQLLVESSLDSQIESSTMGIDSSKNQVILPLDGGR